MTAVAWKLCEIVWYLAHADDDQTELRVERNAHSGRWGWTVDSPFGYRAGTVFEGDAQAAMQSAEAVLNQLREDSSI